MLNAQQAKDIANTGAQACTAEEQVQILTEALTKCMAELDNVKAALGKVSQQRDVEKDALQGALLILNEAEEGKRRAEMQVERLEKRNTALTQMLSALVGAKDDETLTHDRGDSGSPLPLFKQYVEGAGDEMYYDTDKPGYLSPLSSSSYQ